MLQENEDCSFKTRQTNWREACERSSCHTRPKPTLCEATNGGGKTKRTSGLGLGLGLIHKSSNEKDTLCTSVYVCLHLGLHKYLWLHFQFPS